MGGGNRKQANEKCHRDGVVGGGVLRKTRGLAGEKIEFEGGEKGRLSNSGQPQRARQNKGGSRGPKNSIGSNVSEKKKHTKT